MFEIYRGDLIGLPTNENHLVYKWKNPGCKVLFSMTRCGNAASIHIAADEKGVFRIRTALNQFSDFIFSGYPWCEMILGKIQNKKLGYIVERCGFKKIVKTKDTTAYMRER